MPNCTSFLVTEAERKHVRRRAPFGRCIHIYYIENPVEAENSRVVHKRRLTQHVLTVTGNETLLK